MYNKYLILIIILLLNTLWAYPREEEKRFSLSVRESSLKEIILELERKTPYSFVYGSGLDLLQKRSVHAENQSITSILDSVFEGTAILWKIKGDHIVLTQENVKYTISGYIIDKATKETLIGASIMESNKRKGTVSNSYGYFTHTLPQGKVELHISYVGYQNQSIVFDLTKDTILSVQMEVSNWLNEVIIDERQNKPFSPNSGVMELTMSDIKNTPALMGEADVIKTLQLLPGVQAGVEGTSGLYVRGGGPDQNLTLLDGVNVYNINHVYGLFSIFNGDAIKKVTLYKGSFPARFGGGCLP
ncbi:MAG: TonB-dependent receptor [Bacteroidales bacterium]|nr:TonB-dependent receptor [Bacteroidales bacterium]